MRLAKQHPVAPLALVCALAAAFPALQSAAETCISPYIKALKQPEKVMYLWALPATAGEGEDFLAVIDVSLASPTYGKILKKIPVGSTGNEAHHIGFTDDRTKIWAASLNTSRMFIFDVGEDPVNPKLTKVLDNVPQVTGLDRPAHAVRHSRTHADQHGVGPGRHRPRRARRVHQRRTLRGQPQGDQQPVRNAWSSLNSTA